MPHSFTDDDISNLITVEATTVQPITTRLNSLRSSATSFNQPITNDTICTTKLHRLGVYTDTNNQHHTVHKQHRLCELIRIITSVQTSATNHR